MLLSAAALAGCAPETDPEVVLPEAREVLENGETRRAVILLRNLLEAHPDNAEARALLGLAWLAEGDLLAAELELERARSNGAEGRELAFALAGVKLGLGKPGDALAALESMAGSPLDADEQYRLELMTADARLALGELDAAAAGFERAGALDGEQAAPMLGLARIAARRGDVDGARERVADALEANPGSRDGWLLSGMVEVAAGEPAAACERFQRAAELDQRTDRVTYAILVALGECRFMLGDTEGVEASLAQLKEHFAEQPATGYLEARLAAQQGDLPTALRRLREIVARHPGFVAAEVLLSAVHLQLGNVEQAEQYARTAASAAPENPQLRLLLAEIERRRGNPDAAAAALVDGLVASTGNVGLFLLAARTELAGGDVDAGLDLLRRAVEANPEGSTLALQMAASLIAEGQIERARAVLDALPADGDAAFGRRLLLIPTHLAAGDHAAARAEVEALLEAEPENALVLNLAGAVHETAGDLGQARAYYESAARLPDGAPAADLSLARIAWMEGDVDGARAVLAAAIAAQPARIELRLALAEMIGRAGQFAEARDVLDGLPRDAIEPDAMTRLANAYARLGGLAEAESLAGRVVEAAPESLPGWRLLASVQGAAGDVESQLATLDRALALHPTDQALMDARLGALVTAGRADEAAEWLDRLAAESGLDEHDADRRRAALLAAQGQLAEAERVLAALWAERPSGEVALQMHRYRLARGAESPEEPLREWLAAEPDDVETRLALAQFQLASGDAAAATESYRRVLDGDPRNVTALNNLAWLYGERNDERAFELAARAQRLAPSRPEIADTYGWLLLQSGRDVALAASLLARAAWLAPQNPDIQFHFAAALAASDRAAEARRLLETVLRSHASFESRSDAEALLERLSG